MNNLYHNRKGIKLLFGIFWLFIFYMSLAIALPGSSAAETYQFLQKWPATQWYFNSPHGVAVDTAGNVYVADTSSDRIQKFDSGGVLISTWGSSGNGNGQFSNPYGVAVDSTGNVYVADTGNNRIQKFNSSGVFISTWGSFGSGNGQFYYPQGVAVDSTGNVYVADTTNNRIQKFDSAGVFITKWGSPGSGDGQFGPPSGVAVDSTGNVYVTDGANHRIQKFDSAGVFIAKWGSPGSGDGQFYYPRRLAVDSAGNVYVSDYYNFRIQKFDSSGAFITKWGSFGSGNGQFYYPEGVAVDSTGNVYVAENNNERIQKFDSGGVFISTWGSYGSGNGQFSYPSGVAVDSTGNVYVAETNNHRIQKFDSGGVFISMWGSYGSGNGQFNSPYGVSADAAGNVYVADTNNHRIQKFDSGGVFISTWGSYGSGNGQFSYPHGVAVDSTGNVYVADTGNSRIQKFDSGGVFISKWGSYGTGNGQFFSPCGVAVDATGNVYVADTNNQRIQKFDSSGVFISMWGSYGTGNGQFSYPHGVAVDVTGYVYVADTGNHRIQKFGLVCVDNDGDGYGSPGVATCTNGIATDCDDGNAAINPGAAEVCNGADDNCNTQIDEGVQNTYYQDADSDLYGNATVSTLACTQPSGYVSDDTDCNDGNALINPGAIEVCNGVDDNCNTQIDEGVQNTYYQDWDSDTYGNVSVTTLACSQPSGYVTDDTDCDDSSASIYPGALEVCNGVDDNCNTQIDENVTYPYYADTDGDGYGDAANSTQACSQPMGYVSDDTDCNDHDPATYPGATETPNDGIDQDCNGFDLAVEALINAATGNQQTQAVAWNGDLLEYFVLWQDFRNGLGNPDIYGTRLDKNGNVIAGDLPVITQAAKQAGPWVSYGGGGYVAVWIDQRTSGTTGTDVYGAWILPDGTVSSEFVVTNVSANQRAASVVYNPSTNNFLVTWIDDGSGASDLNIWGAVVNPGGGVSSGPFAMVTATGSQRGPYVRYDYGNSQYFMVWFDNSNGNYDVYGSRVTSGGLLLDVGGLVISNAAGDQKNPRITDRDPYSGISSFVLSWIDFRNGQADIYGALIDEFGTKIGSDIQIAGGSYDQRAASIGVDYIRTGQAVVSWIDKRNGTDFDIYRAQVDQSGVVSGETLVAGAATGAANNQQGPLVTYSEDAGGDNGFLFLWRDNRSGVDYDLYGIKVWP